MNKVKQYYFTHLCKERRIKKGFEAKSLHAQIPPQEKASCKIPHEENHSKQNASTLKYLPAKHL